MSLTGKLALQALLFGLAVCWCAPAISTVTTDRGQVQGVQDGNVTVYKGLPFAAPPVGQLRWRSPQPMPAWAGVKLLDHFGPRCMQQGMYPENAPAESMSEDCLYLNLWVPAHVVGAKLPVMVYIYGGGLANGSGSTPLYAGDVLARQGVIVVTLNYRLGVFGFLAYPQLAKESRRHTTGNYGLLDQIAALEWVHRNIAAFGGDPARVTAFGQSSGSISISALSVSPLAKGLFRYAIGESGGLFEPMQLASNLSESGAEQAGVAFAKRAGASSIEALRRMPAAALLKVPFTPAIVMDGAVVDEPPAQAYRQGRINPAAFMIGSNQDEGVIFLAGKHVTPENYGHILERDFPSWLVKLAAPSPGKTDTTAYAAAARFEGDVRFYWDMWTWARLTTSVGKPAYLYRFDHPTPCTPDEGCVEATRHGDEMPYVFGHDLARTWSPRDRTLSRLMVGCWTYFAKNGSPNGCGLPHWPDYGNAANMMVLRNAPHLTSFRPDRTLRQLETIYRVAVLVIQHPIITGVIALVFVFAVIWVLILLARWIRRLRRVPLVDEG